jgi:hypothetical protein
LIALAAVTLARVIMRRFACASGSQPAGFQPGSGSRTVNAPSIIATK